MRNVTVDKTKLIERLKRHREAHVARLVDATAQWLSRVVALGLKIGQEGATTDADKRAIHVRSAYYEMTQRCHPPASYVNEYDQAIAVFEAEVEAVVELEMHDFNRLWLDNWSWQAGFMSHTATYLGDIDKVMDKQRASTEIGAMLVGEAIPFR